MSVQRSIPTDLTAALLSRKQSQIVEIEIHLFEDCNMSCAYCCQEHNESFGPKKEDFDRKVAIAQKHMLRMKGDNRRVAINLMGGELFQDKYGMDVYQLYLDTIKALRKHAMELYEQVEFGLTTNLTFTDRTGFDWLVEELKREKISVSFRTSFDLKGRNFPSKKVYYENLERYKDIIRCISICLHSPNLKEIINGRDEELANLYNRGYTLNFDWYIPDLKFPHIFMPTDEQCMQGLRALFQRYPESYPVVEWKNNDINPIQCCSENRILIPANELVSNCVYMPHEETKYYNGVNRGTTYDKASTWMEHQGCLECEHYDRCGFYCYAAADYKDRKRMMTCFIKEVLSEFT